MKQRSLGLRVLAVDPTSRGFGFVVLEGEKRLVDWGVKSIRRNKEEGTLVAVAQLFHLYVPDVLVLEDCRDPRSRRGRYARRLIRQLVPIAATRGVQPCFIGVSEAKSLFAAHQARTKHEIAGVIGARFPELVRHRPKLRKPWMSEDERMAIFDAAAFGITHLGATRPASRGVKRYSVDEPPRRDS
jgi:hypothetical protein